MMPGQGLVNVLVAVTIFCFAVLAGMSFVLLEPEGAKIFDSRFQGYSLSEAQSYLTALKGYGNAVSIYLGAFRWLDTIFPALLALCLVLFSMRKAQGVLRLVLLALAAIYLVADYAENMFVARMLIAGPDALEQELVDRASRMTQVKWAALFGAVVIGAILRFRARSK